MTSRFALAIVTLALVLTACSSSTDGHPTRPAGRSGSAGSTSSAAAPSGTGSASGPFLVRADHLTTVVRNVGTGNGSVRVTASVTPGHFLPPSSLGLGCWLAAAPARGGYVFLIDDLEATLSVWDPTAGDYRQLVRDDAPGALHVHAANRLDAECRHADGHWQFSLTVNGNLVLKATYSGDDPAGGASGTAVGVAVHGSRAEVRFDDVAVTGL